VADFLALYFRLVWARVRSQLQYRTSFVFYVLGSFVLTVNDFLIIWVIFQHLPLLAGWSLGEVAFFYGTSYISFKTTDMVLGHMDQLPEMVRTGTLDTLLTRPLSSLFQVITADFALRHLGSITQGIIVLAYALSVVDISWDVGRVAAMAMMLVCGSLIFAAVWVVGASTVFWTTGSGLEVLNTFTYGGNQLTSYPLNIYGGWLRRILAFVIPLGFVNYFPSLYILDRPDPIGAPAFLRFAAPLVAIAALLVARSVWGLGVRHYRSTGS
jgi:ABC-2 type transport system permease protein